MGKKWPEKLADWEEKAKKSKMNKKKPPKALKPVKEPELKPEYDRFLGADARELSTQTEVAKKMLLNWNFKSSDIYWEKIMGMQPRKKQKNEKKKKQKKKKAKQSRSKKSDIATN